jgi:hypothetical protein
MQDIQRMTLLDHQPPAQPEFADREAWKQHLRKWGVYAAAAGAALATTTRADADIIYGGVLDITVTPPASSLFVRKGSTKSISINHHRLAARAGMTFITFRVLAFDSYLLLCGAWGLGSVLAFPPPPATVLGMSKMP